MKNAFFVILTILVAQVGAASDLVIMKYHTGVNVLNQDVSGYRDDIREKIKFISASNVDGSTIVTAVGSSVVCQVTTNTYVEAIAIVSAVSASKPDTVLECYTREPYLNPTGLQTGKTVRTSQIRIYVSGL